MTTRTLFQISDDLRTIADLLDEDVLDGEQSEEQKKAIDEFFAECAENLDEKVDNYCSLMLHFKALAQARKDESDRLARLASVNQNAHDRLKARLYEFMKTMKQTKLDTPRHKLWIQNNGGALPVILSEHCKEHPEELGERYRKTVFTPKMSIIAEDLLRLADLTLKRDAAYDQENTTAEPFSDDEVTELKDLHDNLRGVATLGLRGDSLRMK